MLKTTQVLTWRSITVVSLVLGAVGLLLPIVPTVPFLIVAAWAAGKGWPELEARLLDHPRYGEPIRRWRERGAVSRRAKGAATLMMVSSGTGLQFIDAAQWAKIGVPVCMALVAVWLWMRPDR